MSEHTAPPVPGLQGKLPGRFQLIMQALQEGGKREFQKDPLGFTELATSPIPVLGDIAGLAAGTERFIEEPSVEEAILTALGLAPFVTAGSVKSILPKVTKEFSNKVEILEDQWRKLVAKMLTNKAAMKRIAEIRGDVQTFTSPVLSGTEKAGLVRSFSKSRIWDPDTGELVKFKDTEQLNKFWDTRVDRAMSLDKKISAIDNEFEKIRAARRRVGQSEDLL